MLYAKFLNDVITERRPGFLHIWVSFEFLGIVNTVTSSKVFFLKWYEISTSFGTQGIGIYHQCHSNRTNMSPYWFLTPYVSEEKNPHRINVRIISWHIASYTYMVPNAIWGDIDSGICFSDRVTLVGYNVRLHQKRVLCREIHDMPILDGIAWICWSSDNCFPSLFSLLIHRCEKVHYIHI